jgi:hypothetical protein
MSDWNILSYAIIVVEKSVARNETGMRSRDRHACLLSPYLSAARMAPNRSGTNETQKKTKNARRAKNEASSSSQAVPGVQKIKSSLRQTRRLLAKVFFLNLNPLKGLNINCTYDNIRRTISRRMSALRPRDD